MNILDKYGVIRNYGVKPTDAIKTFTVNKKPDPIQVLPTIRRVTIAEINPLTETAITAHKLKDYRRKAFSLMLLPDVHIVLDELLRDVGDINEYHEFKGQDAAW